jgi:AcrR family transcriptional regulator
MLLDSAEFLIATGGLEALTIGAVQEHAMQRNKSAVSYHFGSRQGLIEAVIARMVERLNARRQVMLDALDVDVHDAPTSVLIELLVGPHIDGVLESDESYEARCLQQCAMSAFLVPTIRQYMGMGNSTEARQTLQQRFGGTSPIVQSMRVDFAMSLAISWISQFESFRHFGVVAEVPRDVIRMELIGSCIAIVESAPATGPDSDPDWGPRFWARFRAEALGMEDPPGQ